MTITSWELDYATIKPWIIAAPQTERDLLKNDRWKDFFIAVCNNLTIVEAVNDIGCDLVTFTWAIEEYNESFAFANTEEADIACAIMNRDINDGVFNGRDEHRPKAYAERAREQIIVADEMENLVGAGATATWRGSGPGSGTTFEQWASAASEGVAPSIVPSTVINCWEMVLLAAFRCGAIDWNRIHALYDPTPPDWGAFLVDQLSFNSRISYNPASPGTARPIRGDVVFFDGASHVALAAGSVDSLGRTQIYSFWPPPNTPFNTAHPQYATVDQVKLTTIEELNDYWVANGNPAFVLEFATANW
ncbi:MAG: hypothetical protein EPGJADBJ_03631 [Saprospiraceae bacterium]|nr:hypothetical protein [Saprospiraceae bacterium]